VIAVDTSALVAIVLDEPKADLYAAVLRDEEEILISAGTVAEALIVAVGRNFVPDMIELIAELNCEIVPVTLESARRIGAAYRRWGRGFHPAALNFGDCFAYVVAKERSCRLLYVGGDFAKTDIEGVL
jgi:ribonuclease VapC